MTMLVRYFAELLLELAAAVLMVSGVVLRPQHRTLQAVISILKNAESHVKCGKMWEEYKTVRGFHGFHLWFRHVLRNRLAQPHCGRRFYTRTNLTVICQGTL